MNEKEKIMNSYAIRLRKAGYYGTLDSHQYDIVAESLDDAIERAKTEIPNDFGSEFRYELFDARETAREVLVPKAEPATKSKGKRR